MTRQRFSVKATALIHTGLHKVLQFLAVMEQIREKKKNKNSAFQDAEDFKPATEIMNRRALSVGM